VRKEGRYGIGRVRNKWGAERRGAADHTLQICVYVTAPPQKTEERKRKALGLSDRLLFLGASPAGKTTTTMIRTI